VHWQAGSLRLQQHPGDDAGLRGPSPPRDRGRQPVRGMLTRCSKEAIAPRSCAADPFIQQAGGADPDNSEDPGCRTGGPQAPAASIPTTIESAEMSTRAAASACRSDPYPPDRHEPLHERLPCDARVRAACSCGGQAGQDRNDTHRVASGYLPPGEYIKIEGDRHGLRHGPEVVKGFRPLFHDEGSGGRTGPGPRRGAGIVRGHGGQVTVYSEPAWDNLHVYLPVTSLQGNGGGIGGSAKARSPRSFHGVRSGSCSSTTK